MNCNLLITAAIATTAVISGCGVGEDEMKAKYDETLKKEGIKIPLEEQQKSEIWNNVKSELGKEPNKENLKKVAATICQQETSAEIAYGMRAAGFIIETNDADLDMSGKEAGKILLDQCGLKKLRETNQFFTGNSQKQQSPKENQQQEE